MADNDQDQAEPEEGSLPFREISSLDTAFDRKKLLEITAFLIEDTYARVSGERFRPREGDTVRLSYIRALKELIALHGDLLKASSAPAYEGLPKPPEPEDLELETAKKREMQNLQRMIVGLPPLPDPDQAALHHQPMSKVISDRKAKRKAKA